MSHQFALWSLLFLCLNVYSSSIITPISFGIVTNDNFNSQSTTTTLALYWNKSRYKCNIEPLSSNQYYQCDIEKNIQKQTNDNNPNKNELHITSSNYVSIKSIVIWDNNNNYHEINSFCTMDIDNIYTCENSITLKSTIIQLPPNHILISSPNENHEGFLQYVNDNNMNTKNELHPPSPPKRRLPDTGSGPNDFDYLTITLSNISGSGIIAPFQIKLWWQEYEVHCVIKSDNYFQWPIPEGATVVCNDTYPTGWVWIYRNDIALADSFIIEFSSYNTNDDGVRIESFRLYTVNGNYYEIDEFCVPSVLDASPYMSATIPCISYPHKYSTPYIVVHPDFLPYARIYFNDAIPGSSLQNKPLEGLVKMMKPGWFTVTFSGSITADYTLYWDEYIIRCANIGSDGTQMDCSTPSATHYKECGHESKFMLHIYIPNNNYEMIITKLTINDLSGTYGVDTFCIPPANTEWHPPDSRGITSNESCIEYPTLDEWDVVCVGTKNKVGKCSDRALTIKLPHNILSTTGVNLGEAEIINGDDNIPATCKPTNEPTRTPSRSPTQSPTQPTTTPSKNPTKFPTITPSTSPTKYPTKTPSKSPTKFPTTTPSKTPTISPTIPTIYPTYNPSITPTKTPTLYPTIQTTIEQQGQQGAFENNPVYVWIDESNTNKFIAIVGLSILFLICCLICYICYIAKKCCFKNNSSHLTGRYADAKHPQSASTETLNKTTKATTKQNSVLSASSLSTNNPTNASVIRPNSLASNSKPSSIAMTAVNKYKPRAPTVPSLIVPHRDEYIVKFTSKPFGIAMSPLKKDRYNLYVSKVDVDSQAEQNNVRVGAKLVAINGDSIEGIGSKEIYKRLGASGVPVEIMFRKRLKKRKRNPREQSEVPSQSDGEGGYAEGSFDDAMDEYDDMYPAPAPPGTPVQQTPSVQGNMVENYPSKMNLAAVQEQKAPEAYSMAQQIELQQAGSGSQEADGYGDGNITGNNLKNEKINNNNDTSSDSDDQMYEQGNDTPTLDEQETIGYNIKHVQSKESLDLQAVVTQTVDIPDPDSSDDNDDRYKKNKQVAKGKSVKFKMEEKENQMEDNDDDDMDDDGNFVFQT